MLLDVSAQTGRFLDHFAGKSATFTPAPQSPSIRNRCLTMEVQAEYLRQHPEAQAMSDALQRTPPPTPSTQRVQAITTVPVVFHIVGSAARQAQVTDADI